MASRNDERDSAWLDNANAAARYLKRSQEQFGHRTLVVDNTNHEVSWLAIQVKHFDSLNNWQKRILQNRPIDVNQPIPTAPQKLNKHDHNRLVNFEYLQKNF